MTTVLTVNAGSSSLKLHLVGPGGHVVDQETVDQWDCTDLGAIEAITSRARSIDAVAHRVVHGGPRFSAAVRLDPAVLDEVQRLVPFDPLHQPRALLGIEHTSDLLPEIPAFVCFDTAFHATVPPAVTTYALPADWRNLGVRRYGFHGLSHGSAARRAAQLIGRSADELRIVTCHLGSGSSLCAVDHGRSVDTTMGLTPLDGLVMATRPGAVDPGALAWLLSHGHVTLDALVDGLYNRSGLLALAGRGGDLRVIVADADAGRSDAVLAVDLWLHRLRAGIAAMAAAMAGMDMLVFTGGVGEHQPVLRRRAAEGLGFLGVAIDDGHNDAAGGDTDISARGARCRSVVVTCREEEEMARQVSTLFAEG